MVVGFTPQWEVTNWRHFGVRSDSSTPPIRSACGWGTGTGNVYGVTVTVTAAVGVAGVDALSRIVTVA